MKQLPSFFQNDEVVNELTNIEDKDVTAYKKYLLNVIQFQSTVLQKLLEMGIDLEVFLKELPTQVSDNSLLPIRDINNGNDKMLSLKLRPSDISVPNKLFFSEEGKLRGKFEIYLLY